MLMELLSEGINTDNLIERINRTREITNDEIESLLKESYENSLKYELCGKCGLKARKRESGMCSSCGAI